MNSRQSPFGTAVVCLRERDAGSVRKIPSGLEWFCQLGVFANRPLGRAGTANASGCA